MNERELRGESLVSGVMRGCRFAVEEAGLGEDERAGADRDGKIGVFGGLADPVQHGIAGAVLGRNDDELGLRRIIDREVGNDLHPATRLNRRARLCDGI